MRRTWCNQIMLSNGQYKTVEFDWKILSICFHLASLSYDLCCALTSADQTIMTRTPSQQNFVCRPKSKLEISILGVKYFRCCGILAYRFSEDQLAADTSYLSHNTHTHTQRTVAGLFPSNKPIISVIIRFAMIHTVLSVCFFFVNRKWFLKNTSVLVCLVEFDECYFEKGNLLISNSHIFVTGKQ